MIFAVLFLFGDKNGSYYSGGPSAEWYKYHREEKTTVDCLLSEFGVLNIGMPWPLDGDVSVVTLRLWLKKLTACLEWLCWTMEQG